MTTVLFVFMVVTCFVVVGLCLGIYSMRSIEDTEELFEPTNFQYAVVIAARNEGPNLEEVIHRLAAQSFPPKEIVLVNDRSEDDTQLILERLKKTYSNLRPICIRDLPKGWLGKNHALWQGMQACQSEYVVFTDGDVHFEVNFMKKVASYVSKYPNLDHLSIWPTIVCPSFILHVMMSYFSLCFQLAFRVWKVRDPQSDAFVGIGAFNLVKRSSYFDIGGHRAIAMRPDDDLKLGKLFKDSKKSSDCILGHSLISVTWYSSLWQMFLGLEKNIFSGFDYQLPKALIGLVVLFLCQVFPFAFLILSNPIERILVLLVAFLWIAATVFSNRRLRIKGIYALFFPLGAVLFLLIAIRAITKNILDGGIYWRGTFYSFEELKQGSIWTN